MSELARRQQELIVAGAALVRKRAGAVAHHLPIETSMLGDRFGSLFAEWADGRPKGGSWKESREFLEHLYTIEALGRPVPRRKRWFSRRKGSSL